jgi:hypothetical protein
MKENVDAWFKLLQQEEGEFYSVPISPDESLSLCKRFDVSDLHGLEKKKADNKTTFEI